MIETETQALASKEADSECSDMCFSDSWLKRARHKPDSNAQLIFWDSLIQGLGARIYASGKRSFVLRYYRNKQKKLITLGDLHILGVERARDLARQLLLDLMAGKDPETVLALMRGNDQTLSEFANDYLEKYAKCHVKTWKQYRRRIENVILPALGRTPLSRISRLDVIEFHRVATLERGKYEANRCLQVLSGIYSQAVLWGIVESNPCKGVRKNKELSRDRFVSDSELPRLAEAINSYPDSVARGMMWLYLLTGLRKTELMSLKWCDVDLENNCIVVQDANAKNARRYYPRLSPVARQIFEALPQDDVYVFPGVVPGTSRKYFERPWRHVKKQSGLLDVRLHDLRRTVGSWIVQAGYSAKILDEVLNQKSERARAVYARFSSSHAQGAFDIVADKVRGFVG